MFQNASKAPKVKIPSGFSQKGLSCLYIKTGLVFQPYDDKTCNEAGESESMGQYPHTE